MTNETDDRLHRDELEHERMEAGVRRAIDCAWWRECPGLLCKWGHCTCDTYRADELWIKANDRCDCGDWEEAWT